jgi:pantetheine-phosphate adenylyltransferase
MKIAVFPGSFDPITNAHIDIIKRALPLFDKVYIAIGVNSAKEPFISYTIRHKILETIFISEKNKIIIDSYEGLTINYCKKVNAKFIIRGMRNVSDFEYEQPISQNNQLIDEEVQTIFLISSPGFSHISSTIVREIYKNGGSLSKLVPKEVIDLLPQS